MIGAEVNGTNWTFRYNANNQMYFSKIADEYDCVIDERFYIYDGLDCIAETDTDGEILREYIRIGNVGGIVAEIRHNDTTCVPGYESGTYYYHYNHRGDVIAVSSHNGGIIFKADYDAYGKIMRIDSGSFAPRYSFSTKRYFKELELYYYGYRWYIPELGRWTTDDPIGLKGGTCNLYNFCNNSPLIYTDFHGLWTGKYHKKWTLESAKKYASKLNAEQRKKLAESAKLVDKWHPLDGNYHGMVRGWEDHAIASINMAKDFMDKGMVDMAIHCAAYAIHAYQDSATHWGKYNLSLLQHLNLNTDNGSARSQAEKAELAQELTDAIIDYIFGKGGCKPYL